MAVGFSVEIPKAGIGASAAVEEEGVEPEAGDPVTRDKGTGATALGTSPKPAVAAGFGAEIPEAGIGVVAAVKGKCAEPEAEDPDAGRAPAMRSRARSAFQFRLLAPNSDSKTESEALRRVAPPPVTETGDPPAEDEASGAPTMLSACRGVL
jgi:hypothetical protein